jgi:hypothetical protein
VKQILAFILVLSSPFVGAQTFSGQINYVRRIIPLNQKIDVDSLLNDGQGDSAVYSILGQYYKSVIYRKGQQVYTYVYHHPQFRFYFIRPTEDYVSYADSRISHEGLKSIKIHRDSTSTLLGLPTFMAEKQYARYKSKSYYSDSVKVDPETFKGHAAAGWYNELKSTGGPFNLKTITYYKDYTEIYEAVRITPNSVEPPAFDLPYGKKLFASSMAVDKKAKIISTDDARICYGETVRLIPKVPGKSGLITAYILVLVSDEGKILSVRPITNDPYGISKTFAEIIGGCGYEFTPGEIKGKPVTSECIIPMQYRFD